jgi:hypothetical protein
MAKRLVKRTGEQVVVGLTGFQGGRLVDARVYYLRDDGEWCPTRKGLCLRPGLARQVAHAILALCDEIDAEEEQR